MRLFTAIDPPDAIREQLESIQEANELPARWTAPDQFHVTIRFIGDADEEQAQKYQASLDSLTLSSVKCQPYGLDVLPSRRSPRVLTLGLERTDTLMALYESVSSALEAEGLAPEDRSYKPHVTIGRLNDVQREAVHEFLRSHEDATFPTFHVDRLVLYESTLTPDGAIHEPLSTYELSG